MVNSVVTRMQEFWRLAIGWRRDGLAHALGAILVLFETAKDPLVKKAAGKFIADYKEKRDAKKSNG